MIQISEDVQLFKSTDINKRGENRKAIIKNYNIQILQFMYGGDTSTSLCCAISGQPAFELVPDYITKLPKLRLGTDFNHIRQKSTSTRHSGNSLDKKEGYEPSEVFRAGKLDEKPRINELIEFMTIMPVSKGHHSYISQDSAKGDLTLLNFHKSTHTWILKSRRNFNKFMREVGVECDMTYDDLIDHLSDINYPSIYDRVLYYPKKERFIFK